MCIIILYTFCYHEVSSPNSKLMDVKYYLLLFPDHFNLVSSIGMLNINVCN